MAIEVVPGRTSLPTDAIERSHTPPRRKNFRTYVPCLRWEFAFSCAACFRHQADFNHLPGQLSVEHFQLKTVNGLTDKERELNPANCVYLCTQCNNARGSRYEHVSADGHRLLRSDRDAWAAHFELGDDYEMRPAHDDSDAAYTWEAYDLGDRAKTAARVDRELALSKLRQIFEADPEGLQNELAATAVSDVGSRVRKAVDLADELQHRLLEAIQIAHRYQAVPDRAPTRCTCGLRRLELPEWFDEQVELLV